MLRLNDLFEIVSEKNKLGEERARLDIILEELKKSDEPLYKKLAEIDKQLAAGQFNLSQVVVELNKTNEFIAVEQLENIFVQLEKYHGKKREMDVLFNKFMLFIKSIEEMHDFLFGMLSKQKKLSDILGELRYDFHRYLGRSSQKKSDIELLIKTCDELSSFFPYPLLQHDKGEKDPIVFFPAYENYLIQFYLLFSEKNNENDELIKYLFMQIQLGFLYEKNTELLNNFLQHHHFSPAFIAKHDIRSHINILQLLIEPVQYLPRFNLLLHALISKLQAFQLNDTIELNRRLIYVHEKIDKLAKDFNHFLECRYPEEIHLFFLEKLLKESLINHKNSTKENSDITELCLQQPLRTDRLRILEGYMKKFIHYMKCYTDRTRSYFQCLFRYNSETDKLIEIWKNSSPLYVKIFNENQQTNASPSLIFQEGILTLYQTAIRLLVQHNMPNLNSFAKYSLSHFMLAYINELEDILSHLTENEDYVPRLTMNKIEEQLARAGEHTVDRKNRYHYYQSLYAMTEKTMLSQPTPLPSLFPSLN